MIMQQTEKPLELDILLDRLEQVITQKRSSPDPVEAVVVLAQAKSRGMSALLDGLGREARQRLSSHMGDAYNTLDNLDEAFAALEEADGGRWAA